jgi:hypothetical protein
MHGGPPVGRRIIADAPRDGEAARFMAYNITGARIKAHNITGARIKARDAAPLRG